MTAQIYLSQIHSKEEFALAVKSHIDTLHAFLMEVGKPRPVAHPMIEDAIKRVRGGKNKRDTYIPDYDFVDDLPKESDAKEQAPKLTMEQKRQAVQQKLTVAENEAKFKLLPARKMRLFNLQNQEARLKKEEDRTKEDNEIIATYDQMRERFVRMEIIGAKAESDLEDMTEEQLDNWVAPDFGD